MVSRGRDTCSVKFVFLRCLSFSCKAGLAVSKVRDYQLIRIDGIAERENANQKVHWNPVTGRSPDRHCVAIG